MPSRFSHVDSIGKFEVTPEGFLRIPAAVTRVGVFNYKQPDGSVIRELRLPEEVFNPDSLASLKSIPITNDHPREGMVTPANAKSLSVGATSDEVETDEEVVSTRLNIFAQDGIDAVKAGRNQLSCGYVLEKEMTPGVWKGQPYDLIQRNIRYNHLALVDSARGGDQLTFRLDSEDAIMVKSENKNYNLSDFKEKPKKDGGNMKKITINGMEFEVSPELYDAYMAEQAVNTDTKAQLDALKKAPAPAADPKAAAAAQANMDSLGEKITALEAENKTLKAEKEKIRLDGITSAAKKVLPTDFKFDGLNEHQIKRAVIEASVSASGASVNLDGKSNDYLDVRFDSILEAFQAEESRRDPIADHLLKLNQDGNKDVPAPDAARAKMVADTRDAWKTKTPAAV